MPQLIHHMYTPLSEVVANYDAQCVAKGINPKQFVWEGSPHPHLFSDDRGEAVVLDRSFSTLEQEISFTWLWAAKQHDRSWWRVELKTDAKHLFLLGDVEYPSWRQRWVRILRTANYSKSPASVLTDDRPMPGREILSMLAQHPEVARRMDGSAEHPFLWTPGLECKDPGNTRRLVPGAWFNAGDSRLGVDVDRRGHADPRYSVPEFVEE